MTVYVCVCMRVRACVAYEGDSSSLGESKKGRVWRMIMHTHIYLIIKIYYTIIPREAR